MAQKKKQRAVKQTESDRLALIEKQKDALYRAIGEFSVKFEHVCEAIQTAILFLLGAAGLKNQRIAQIMLAGLTADPLRTLFESLVAEVHPLNPREKAIFKNALTRFQKLTNDRNDIIHCTWFIGWGTPGTIDVSTAAGMKLHKNSTGVVFKSFNRQASDFQPFIDEADALAKIFARLDGCFVYGWSVEKNFQVDGAGKVSVPS